MIFTGRTATYAGPEETFDDGRGNRLQRGIPIAISDAAAERLSRIADLVLTGPTYQAKGGCC